MQGKFITFEGGEGTGKSTQIKLLAEYLQQHGKDVLLTKEPGGTDIGLELRKILLEGKVEKLDAVAETLMFFADRRIHMQQKVWPAMQNGQWVLSDRFADSTMVYQCYADNKGISYQDIMALYKFSVGNFKPDLTIILDIDPKVGLARSFKKAEGMLQKELRFESKALQWHERVRQGYLQIAQNEPERCVVLNADKSIADLHQDVITAIKEKFKI